MDISSEEQRVLHALAQGGVIEPLKNDNGRITASTASTATAGCMGIDLPLFKKLRRKKPSPRATAGPTASPGAGSSWCERKSTIVVS